MLHLTKLAVGVRDTDHLHELQAERMLEPRPAAPSHPQFPEAAGRGSGWRVDLLGDLRNHDRAAARYGHHRGPARRSDTVYQPDPGPPTRAPDWASNPSIPGLALPRSRRRPVRYARLRRHCGIGRTAILASAGTSSTLPTLSDRPVALTTGGGYWCFTRSRGSRSSRPEGQETSSR